MAKYKIVVGSEELVLEGENLSFDVTNKLSSIGIAKKEFSFNHKTNDLTSDDLLYTFYSKLQSHLNTDEAVLISLVSEKRESKVLELDALTDVEYIATPTEDSDIDYDFRETLAIG